MNAGRAGWARRVLGGTVMAGVLAGGGIAYQVRRTSGGLEEWVGDTVSDLRSAHPVLIEPIAWLETSLEEGSYRWSLWRNQAEGDGDAADTPSVASSGQSTGTSDVAERGQTAMNGVGIADEPNGPDGDGVEGGQDALEGQAASRGRSDAGEVLAPVPRPERVLAAPVAPPLRWRPSLEPGLSWLQVAHLVANPDFPRQPALALRISSRDAQLHWQPGTRYPCRIGPDRRPQPDRNPRPDRSGKLEVARLRQPLLAFGGGFESTGFRMYGAIHQGRVMVPLTQGIQTLITYSDGTVRMGPWGSDALPTEGILEARQNLPPLVHEGRIPRHINWLNIGTRDVRSRYDEHHQRIFEEVHTWRSGLGLTPEGDVVYVFGPRLTPAQLAGALIRAGAVEAMMLDINAAYHCAPSLFEPDAGGAPRLVPLYPGVIAGRRFLSGSRKDFFYVQARHSARGGA